MKYKILSRTTQKDILDMDERSINKSIYFYIRDTAWRFLIDNNITELPVNLVKIAKNNKWGIYNYESIHDKELFEEAQKYLGMTVLGEDDRFYILYNKEVPSSVKRFTIAHEFGHIKLDHFQNKLYTNRFEIETTKEQEREANMFAARILMPTIALKHLEVSNEQEIMELCNVSQTAAKHRLNRIKNVLDKRGKYDTSPLERQVHQMLWEYLEANKKK